MFLLCPVYISAYLSQKLWYLVMLSLKSILLRPIHHFCLILQALIHFFFLLTYMLRLNCTAVPVRFPYVLKIPPSWTKAGTAVNSDLFEEAQTRSQFPSIFFCTSELLHKYTIFFLFIFLKVFWLRLLLFERSQTRKWIVKEGEDNWQRISGQDWNRWGLCRGLRPPYLDCASPFSPKWMCFTYSHYIPVKLLWSSSRSRSHRPSLEVRKAPLT